MNTTFHPHPFSADGYCVRPVKLGTGRRLVEVLVDVGLARSNSEARRMIKQRGVRVNDEVVTDIYARLLPA